MTFLCEKIVQNMQNLLEIDGEIEKVVGGIRFILFAVGSDLLVAFDAVVVQQAQEQLLTALAEHKLMLFRIIE